MARLDAGHYALGFKDCTPQVVEFTSDHVQRIVPVRWETLSTQRPQPFRLPQLKQTLFAEAQHYLDRAIYHLIVGKRLIADGSPTWGSVSFYYASFFAVQCAIRLRGTCFVRLDYRETPGIPTYRLEVVNLLTDEFQVRQAGAMGEHLRVWNAFYEAFRGLAGSAGWAEFWPVTEGRTHEDRFAEMHRRHLVNYAPGYGYSEVGPLKNVVDLTRKLSRDNFANLADSLADQDVQLETKAVLRAKLCVRLLLEIVKWKGAYQSLHQSRMAQRRQWLGSMRCPEALTRTLGGILDLTVD